jgi:hypothetical protein
MPLLRPTEGTTPSEPTPQALPAEERRLYNFTHMSRGLTTNVFAGLFALGYELDLCAKTLDKLARDPKTPGQQRGFFLLCAAAVTARRNQALDEFHSRWEPEALDQEPADDRG